MGDPPDGCAMYEIDRTFLCSIDITQIIILHKEVFMKEKNIMAVLLEAAVITGGSSLTASADEDILRRQKKRGCLRKL